jgi:hypothetical protein
MVNWGWRARGTRLEPDLSQPLYLYVELYNYKWLGRGEKGVLGLV